jgi:antitoxin component of RelBE/YafQ-DinJ toxin-antitoxin module
LPKSTSETKRSIIYVRVTKRIKDLVKQQAAREGITPSEWVRSLIVRELRERGVLPTLFEVPEVEKV